MKDPLPVDSKKAAVVRSMFDRIAPRYDLLNRIISLRLDQRWRQRAVCAVGITGRDTVVDLACGTGDFSELAVRSGACVLGIDFSAQMLAGARRRQIAALFVQADANALPLPDGWATVIVSGFALRNFVSIPVALAETARVLAAGGRLALLEVDTPRSRLLRWGHDLYFTRLVPRLGALLSDATAYAYLPRSVTYLPPSNELREMMVAAGFHHIVKQALAGGAAQLITAMKN